MTNSGLLWCFTFLYLYFQYLKTKVPKQVFVQMLLHLPALRTLNPSHPCPVP